MYSECFQCTVPYSVGSCRLAGRLTVPVVSSISSELSARSSSISSLKLPSLLGPAGAADDAWDMLFDLSLL